MVQSKSQRTTSPTSSSRRPGQLYRGGGLYAENVVETAARQNLHTKFLLIDSLILDAKASSGTA